MKYIVCPACDAEIEGETPAEIAANYEIHEAAEHPDTYAHHQAHASEHGLPDKYGKFPTAYDIYFTFAQTFARERKTSSATADGE